MRPFRTYVRASAGEQTDVVRVGKEQVDGEGGRREQPVLGQQPGGAATVGGPDVVVFAFALRHVGMDLCTASGGLLADVFLETR